MDIAFLPLSGSVLTYAQSCLEKARADGSVPKSVPFFNGEETAFVARFPTHDGFIRRGIAVFYEEERGNLWLDLLYVEPEFRRQNVGWQLIEKTRSFAVQQRFSSLSIGVLASNAPMRALMGKAPGLFQPTTDSDGKIYFSEHLSRRAVR